MNRRLPTAQIMLWATRTLDSGSRRLTKVIKTRRAEPDPTAPCPAATAAEATTTTLAAAPAPTAPTSVLNLVERRAEPTPPAPSGSWTSAGWTGYSDFAEETRRHLDNIVEGGCVGVLAVEIDHFEALTTMHGGTVGVEILSATAARIREAVRPHDIVARVDGNGFALAWRQKTVETVPADIGSRISRQFETPVPTSAGDLSVTVTIGVTAVDHLEGAAAEPQVLLAQARAAVVAARARGRSRITEFDPIMLEHAVQTYTTERQLRTAVRDGLVDVDFQPIVNLHTGRVVGVEALARWHDELFGQISPSLFIPIAEDSGLINDLGRIVLSTAIAQGARWQHESDNGLLLTINLSNNQLLDPSLIPMIKRLLAEHGLAPKQLCLEITESVVMANVAASMTILCQLKDLGVLLAIDDFGTGYSSLSYLRRLPVDILKIDRSFVQALHNRDDRIIAKVIIDLAHTFGMTTVAEGVELASQVEVLHSLNCDMAQGFLLHRPTPPHAVDLSAIDMYSLPVDLSDTADPVSGNHGWPSSPRV